MDTDDLAHLSEQLRLLQLELASVRQEFEKLAEDQERVRRGRRRAVKESGALSRALADALYRELRNSMETPRRRRRLRGRQAQVSPEEWQQVMLLHRSPSFRGAWYLRQNPNVARRGIEPALHFLRFGVIEGRDPGPDFDVRDYLTAHPELHETGENPVLHAMRMQDASEAAPPRRST